MSTINVNFDGHAFVPDEPVDIPAGTKMQIMLVRPTVDPSSPEFHDAERPLMGLLKLLERLPKETEGPTDWAAEHDHYLYGMPKLNDANPSDPS